MKQIVIGDGVGAKSDTAEPVQLLLRTVYFIYFFCGLTQCFESVFLPEFKEYFKLGYQQQMYTMFAKNIPFVLAPLVGLVVRSVGYKNCLSVAMAFFAAGTFLLIPGLQSHRYDVVLLGFFLIGIGFNCEIVAGNPMLAALGPAEGGSSRLNLGNALGAVAQIIAPATLSLLIPAQAITASSKLPYMERLFTTLGIVLAVVCAFTFLLKDVNITKAFRRDDFSGSTIWSNRRVLLGFTAIFLTLGVEASQFGFFRNYLEDPAIAGLTAVQSQRLFTVFFALFAAGRLMAAWIQGRVAPSLHLVLSAAAATFCLFVIVFAKGIPAIVAVTSIGFLVSIFFPTLYAMAIQGMGDLTGKVSGLLTMGFAGCAIIPVVQGKIADVFGLQHSYALGFAAYLFAGYYAFYLWRRSLP